MNALASDNNGVTKVVFTTNSGYSYTDSVGSDGWNFSWNTMSLNGIYTITATAYDEAGNQNKSTVYVNLDNLFPIAYASRPSGTYNTKTITLTAQDNFDSNPIIYYSTNNGITWNYQFKTVTLNLNQGKTVLMFCAMDAVGNQCSVQSETYNIDTVAPKVTSTYPKRYATGVSRTKTIYLKFSEKIKSSSYWSKIVVKDKYGHAVKISKSISGNILYIKTSKRSSYSYYTVYIPKAALKDYAGNNLAA